MNPAVLTPQSLRLRVRWLTWVLLLVWALVSFGPGYWARELSFQVWGWPLHFWLAAQGSVLVFLALIIVYATLVNRWETQAAGNDTPASGKA